MRKLNQVINSDFTKPGAFEDTQEWLMKIKPIKARTAPGENVDINVLEKLIFKLLQKNGLVMQWISFTLLDGENPWYTFSIKDGQTHEWVKSIYGLTIYETYCKVCLYLYAYTKKKEKEQDE